MKHSGQTVLWELWAALCLCTALVLPPGSPWLHEPALLYPGLSLAVLVPAAWAAWWMALPPQPLPRREHPRAGTDGGRHRPTGCTSW